MKKKKIGAAFVWLETVCWQGIQKEASASNFSSENHHDNMLRL